MSQSVFIRVCPCDELKPLKRHDSTYINFSAGLLGPTLRAEEGETIVVTFRNMATSPYSISPHGVAYGKQSEGECVLTQLLTDEFKRCCYP